MSGGSKVVRRVVRQRQPAAPRVELPDEPYGGLLDLGGASDAIIEDEANSGLKHGDVARTAPHLLLSGRTGYGKSRTVLVPNILRWGPRPLISMSSKGDVAELTIRKRAELGPVYLLDLSGEVRESELRGVDVTRVRVDPCTTIHTDDEALELAGLLLRIGDISDGGSGDGGGGDSAFWKNLAKSQLAAALRAGGMYPDPATGEPRWGGGIDWVAQAVADVGPDLQSEAENEGDITALDVTTPNWNSIYWRTVGGSRHAESIRVTKTMDERQRDSVRINLNVAVSAWNNDAVSGNQQEETPFHPSMLEGPSTLFIVAGMSGVGGPAVAQALISVVDHWRKRVGELTPIMFVLDEFTNASPIPARYVLQWISEGRGLGIRLVVAMQSTRQLSLLWGQAAAETVRALMPAILVLPGAGETTLLREAAEATPPAERSVATTDASGRVSYAPQLVQPQYAELLPRRKGEGRLLLSGMAGVKVFLPDVAATDLLD